MQTYDVHCIREERHPHFVMPFVALLSIGLVAICLSRLRCFGKSKYTTQPKELQPLTLAIVRSWALVVCVFSSEI